jgi:hypothetical protein
MGRDRRDVQYIITALERARHITFLGDIETNPRILNAHKTAIRALLNRNIAIRPEGVPMPKHQGSVGFFKCENVDKFRQAIKKDKVSAVTLLIEYGFNPMITFSNGNTELHKAAHANSQQVLKYLVNDYIRRGFKSRLEEKNDKGQTALDIAVEKGESDMVEFLKAAALQTSQQQLVL